MYPCLIAPGPRHREPYREPASPAILRLIPVAILRHRREAPRPPVRYRVLYILLIRLRRQLPIGNPSLPSKSLRLLRLL